MTLFRRALAGGATALLVAGSLALGATPASAATVSLTYDLGPGDVQIGAGACSPSPGTDRFAELGSISVTQTGTYSFHDFDTIDEVTGFGDATLWVQVGDTCRQLNFAVTELDLQAGVAYRVVATSASAGATGRFGYEVTGPGSAFLRLDDPADYCFGFVPAPYSVVFGTKKADRIVGTAAPEVFLAGAGDDKVDGGGGNDVLCGGDGGDELTGGDGFDTLVGDAGADRLVGGAGNDTIYGDFGADRLEGGLGDDLLYGGPGADRHDGGPGFDVASDGDRGSSFTNVEIVQSGPR